MCDGEPLGVFVDRPVKRIEPRVNGAVVEIEDVTACKECEDPMMMLDIAENRLDDLAHECDHTPHKFHCISSRPASSSAAGDLAPDGRCRNLAWPTCSE